MRKIYLFIMVSLLLVSFVFTGSVAAKETDYISPQKTSINKTNQCTSSIHPSIADKELNPKYDQPQVFSDPVPEKDMTHIYFSLSWIKTNDQDKAPYSVKITFPQSWFNNTSNAIKTEQLVELLVPTRLLMDHNESPNTGEITINFPTYYFKGLPTAPIPEKPERIEETHEYARAIEYDEWIKFTPTVGDGISGVLGRIEPDSYYNPNNESFCVYHEIEFMGSTYTDAVEIISQFDTYFGQSVWFAVYINGLGSDDWDNYVSVSTSPGDVVTYEFYTRSADDMIVCWLQKNGGAWYCGVANDNSAPSSFVTFRGSTELDTRGGISEYFLVDTYPLSIEGLETSASTWHSASYVDQRLDYHSQSSTDDYVGINYWLNSSGLFFEEWALYLP